MMTFTTLGIVAIVFAADGLTPGDHRKTLSVAGRKRSYLVHVPKTYNEKNPTPVLLALHGAGTNALTMQRLTGLNDIGEKHGSLVVYPNGTGAGNIMLIWNSGGFDGSRAGKRPDDVAFIRALLDELASIANVDSKRVFATGISNGAMMCHRLAIELSDRIAAIAPVAGTLALEDCNPRRPIPIIMFHGTEDSLVPWDGPARRNARFLTIKSVDDTAAAWVRANGCLPTAEEVALGDVADDGTTVSRKTWRPYSATGAEVILFAIKGGGHTWPGRELPFDFLGKTTKDIAANELMWEFFERHPMK